jgi:RimJ/RimL family protein N-acetyltransferase
MEILLETERLVLRQFTADDVDNLVELDSDPDVMHFINGGRPTPRSEIESDVLPTFSTTTSVSPGTASGLQ